jgi:uroporphyrinogen-III synthase
MTIYDLGGRSILVTRPEPEAWKTARQIEQRQGRPLVVPLMVIEPPTDPIPLREAWHHLERYDGILITSTQGSRVLRTALAHGELSCSGCPPVYAVGHKTATALQGLGLTIRVPDHPGDADTLADAVLTWTGGGRRFLFLRAEQGRDRLMERLRHPEDPRCACHVEPVWAYQTTPIPRLPKTTVEALRQRHVAAVTLFSGRTAATFMALLPEDVRKRGPEGMVIAVLSQRTGDAVQAEGWPVTVVAQQPTATSLLDGLADYWNPILRQAQDFS